MELMRALSYGPQLQLGGGSDWVGCRFSMCCFNGVEKAVCKSFLLKYQQFSVISASTDIR